ncbi:MAG: ABC transporter substrate-binding protein [Alphaproteobacteria bacterium]|nr:ABC transporter substrate-binding protein [Alphaproteobacteria bacterium]NCQ67318.1 ABC transporter substrate-binding protein [Alphaproteobacteria bacterium]NCT06715.1 ABC transporter substrate-binding protein [Alphaproteobacteria bacterium]
MFRFFYAFMGGSLFAVQLLLLNPFNKCEAKPQTSMALYGKAKHHDGFTHYEHVNPDAPKEGKVNLSISGTFDSLNPFVIKGIPAAGLSVLYPDLFYVTLMDHSPHEHFSQYAYLAETVDLAEDHLSVTFRVRQDATFHDGSAITAEDVVFSFNTLRQEGSPLYAQYYGDVVKVEALDRYQVKFSFKDAENKELPLLLGHFPIFSKAYYSKNKFDSASDKIPLGNGPYRIVDVDAGRSITYERVKNWWGENLPVAKGRYNFDQVRYIYFRDPEVAFEAFKSKNYDFRVENKIKNWVLNYNFEAVKEGKVHKIETPFVQAGIMQGLVMNTRREIFADTRVRQALTLAFDFEWLNDNYFYNKYERIDSYFWGLDLASSGLPTEAEKALLEPFKDQVPADLFTTPYTLPKTDGSGQNRQALRQAKALLKEAGWDVTDGVLKNSKTGKIFQFDLLLSNMSMTGLLNAYLKNLKRLGIQAKFRVVDTAQYTSRVEDFDYDMIMTVTAQSPSPGNEQREFWGSYVANSKGSRNYAGVRDPVVDALVEKLIDATDRETLVTVVKALDRVLLRGHYVVPLWGSSKLRMAYWNNLKNTGKFPKYNVDFFAWWVDKE